MVGEMSGPWYYLSAKLRVPEGAVAVDEEKLLRGLADAVGGTCDVAELKLVPCPALESGK